MTVMLLGNHFQHGELRLSGPLHVRCAIDLRSRDPRTFISLKALADERLTVIYNVASCN